MDGGDRIWRRGSVEGAIPMRTDLPPEWPGAARLRQAARDALRATRRLVVALDDDPTDSQTVHGVDVLLDWSTERLTSAIGEAQTALYVITNSRSMTPTEAAAVNDEVARRVMTAAGAARRPVAFFSRGDSTLRGHFPLETAVLAGVMAEAGQVVDAVCLVPCFPEGGRVTIGGVHWVREGQTLTPAGMTAFAKDNTFGYRSSRLPDWVREKAGPSRQVMEIALGVVRSGPLAVAAVLAAARGGCVVCFDAVTYADLDVIAAGVHSAEEAGRRFVFRTAGGLVKTFAGVADRSLLTADEVMTGQPRGAGLVVFGSHVPQSTRQPAELRKLAGVEAVELDAAKVMEETTREDEVERCAAELNDAMTAERTGVLFTSRAVIEGNDADDSLQIARQVAAAVMAVVVRVRQRPAFVIGKGGITSCDLAKTGLRATACRVEGQIVNGVSVWRTDERSRWPDVPYVVFPGNVGSDTAVAEVVAGLANH